MTTKEDVRYEARYADVIELPLGDPEEIPPALRESLGRLRDDLYGDALTVSAFTSAL